MHSPEQILQEAIHIAIQIHRELGPGLLESAYQRIVADQLRENGHTVEIEKSIPVVYGGREYSNSFRADLLVDGIVVVEIKSTERPARIHSSQVLTYLRCLNLRHGLLLNFGMERAIDGVDRILNYRAVDDDHT